MVAPCHSSLASGDNDEVLRWFGNDGDAATKLPSACRRSDDDGYGGGDCLVTRGQYALWPSIGLWGYAAPISFNETSQIARCFACAGRIAPSLPSASLTQAILELENWDNGIYSDDASFVHAMAGWTFDDIPFDWPPSILPNAQMIARVNNWLGGTLRPMLVSPLTSPASDPLYYMSLTFIDRLTTKWIDAHNVDVSMLRTNILNGEGATICTPSFLPLTTNGDLFMSATPYTYL